MEIPCIAVAVPCPSVSKTKQIPCIAVAVPCPSVSKTKQNQSIAVATLRPVYTWRVSQSATISISCFSSSYLPPKSAYCHCYSCFRYSFRYYSFFCLLANSVFIRAILDGYNYISSRAVYIHHHCRPVCAIPREQKTNGIRCTRLKIFKKIKR